MCSHRSAFMKNVQIPVVNLLKKCKFGEKSHRSDPFLSFLQNGGLSNRTPTVHRTRANRVETRRHCSRQRRYSSGRTAPFLYQVNYRLNAVCLPFKYCLRNVRFARWANVCRRGHFRQKSWGSGPTGGICCTVIDNISSWYHDISNLHWYGV